MPASSSLYTRIPDSNHDPPELATHPPSPSLESLTARAPPRPLGSALPPPDSPLASSRYTSKDKGKAKANPHDDPSDANDRVDERAHPTGYSYCVRFTDGVTPDVVDLWVGEKESVREVKRRLRLLRPTTLNDGDAPRRLRLIHLGRLLVDGVFLVPWTTQLLANRAKLDPSTTNPTSGDRGGIVERMSGVVRGAVRKSLDGSAASTNEQDEMERGRAGTGTGSGKVEGKGKVPLGKAEGADEQIWLHCSVGEAIQEDDVPTETPPTEQMTPLQGFDRLREAGFSEAEIESMRAEFRETRQFDAGEDEDDDDGAHQRALEEQWMSGMTGREEAVGDSTGAGHYVTLLKGVSIGFFVPFLPLFFFRTQLFSRRMQMAIVLGILINVGFGLLRLLG
ncbi:hypothetical protein JCM10212_001453 [Sporobolomyces blumeae]